MSDQETVQAGVEDTDPADITSRDEILQPKERDEAVSGSINESQSSKLLPQCSPLEGAQRGAADEEKDDDQDLNPEKDVGLELSRDVEANAKPNDISDIADAEYWQATPVVNMDGLEGSGLRAGAYVARYGGGDDFRAVDPLLSAEILRRCEPRQIDYMYCVFNAAAKPAPLFTHSSRTWSQEHNHLLLNELGLLLGRLRTAPAGSRHAVHLLK